jgi:hypothetical protein
MAIFSGLFRRALFGGLDSSSRTLFCLPSPAKTIGLVAQRLGACAEPAAMPSSDVRRHVSVRRKFIDVWSVVFLPPLDYVYQRLEFAIVVEEIAVTVCLAEPSIRVLRVLCRS